MPGHFISKPRYFPLTNRVGIDDLAKAERFVADVDKLTRMEGYESVGISTTLTLTQMAIDVGRAVLASETLAPEEVGLVLFCHHWEEEEWHLMPPFRLHCEMGLRPDVEVLEMRTGNSGSMTRAAWLGAQLMESDHALDNVLVLGSDKINRRVMRRRFGNQVFGDAAAGFLVTRRPTAYEIVGDALVAASSRNHNLEQFSSRIEAAWIEDVQRAIENALERLFARTGLASKDIGAVITPNVGPTLLGRLVSATGLTVEQFHIPSRKYVAHAVISDLFVNLALAGECGELTHRLVLLLSVGMGGNFHLMLLKPEVAAV